MDNPFPEWITKQMLKGVKGFNIDAYLIALEGWRRGLTLRWYYDAADVTDMKIIGFNPLAKTFSLSSREKTHYFYRSRGDRVANEAVDIVTNKKVAKSYLQIANVPAPKGERYTKDVTSSEIIKDVSSSIDYPVVVKPTFGSLGKGVMVNIQTEKELGTSLKHIRDELGYTDIIVEQYIDGEDARVYVMDNQVLAATKRVPAHVIGDGKRTIEELIAEKNKKRKDNPYLTSKLIEIDKDMEYYLEVQDYTLRSVPPEGNLVYVRGQSNVASGGEPINITQEVSIDAKEIAIQAVKAVPGLIHAGVDVLLKGKDTTVIEVNSTADLGMHIFPTIGKTQNVPEGIIDYYFPETIGQAINRTMIYFNYPKIRQLFLNRDFEELRVPDAPQGKLCAKRYVISGKVQKVGYRNWIRKQALKLGLHGYTRNLGNGKVVVVVGSTDRDKVNDFENVCRQGPSRAYVTNVSAYEWLNQVRVGFEVRRK